MVLIGISILGKKDNYKLMQDVNLLLIKCPHCGRTMYEPKQLKICPNPKCRAKRDNAV